MYPYTHVACGTLMVDDPTPKRADRTTPEAAIAAVPPAASGTPRVVHSDQLLAGASQLAILHKQTVYFLRQTRFGKLILTK